MGLPEINIEFKKKVKDVLKRSSSGIVALILKDDIQKSETVVYNSVDEINSTDWSEKNIDYIKKTFLGGPNKVIIEVVSSEETDYSNALKRLSNKRFNYLAVPGIESTDTTSISEWIISKRTNDKKTFKAVLPNQASDHEGIINFTTEEIKVGEKTYSASEYTCRIAGILAGLPFTRSSTYFVLDEVEAITEIDDPNAAIDSGQLILINDGEKIKIGRGVNSLVTIPESSSDNYAYKTEDFKKIKIVEAMDLITDDIRDTFNNLYVGKVSNDYDNQVLFITSINSYFKGLAAEGILDTNYENMAYVNVNAQRKAWEEDGTDTSDWDDQKVKNMTFKSNVFVAGNIKIIDAMEDLDFQIEV